MWTLTNGTMLKEKQDDPQPLYFRRQDSRKYFGISPRTLDDLAMGGKGPPYFRIGKFAIYQVKAFIDWMEDHPKLRR